MPTQINKLSQIDIWFSIQESMQGSHFIVLYIYSQLPTFLYNLFLSLILAILSSTNTPYKIVNARVFSALLKGRSLFLVGRVDI